MKRLLLLVFTLGFLHGIFAQTISVSSFKLLETDLTANTAGTIEKDQNGETAALIKVVTTKTGFTFDGGALGIVKTVQKPSEIWVYVPKGLIKITISHPQYGMLRDFYLNIPIEAARTYEMVIEIEELINNYQIYIGRSEEGGYFLYAYDLETNKTVKVYSEDYMSDGWPGMASFNSPNKKYIFTVTDHLPSASGFPWRLMIHMTDTKTLETKFINSGSALKVDENGFTVATLSRDYDPELSKADTDYYHDVSYDFDGKEVKIGKEYHVKELYERYGKNLINVNGVGVLQFDDIVTTNSLNSNIQSPIPLYGEANIKSNPAEADIYIDDKKVGQTPLHLSKLTIGHHNLRICRQDYVEYFAEFNVKENEMTNLSVDLEKTIEDNSSLHSSDNRRIISIGNISFAMIRVDGGSFTMGATKEQESDGDPSESPAHQVTLSSFHIGETEVTQELWEAIMGNNPSSFKGPKLPVDHINWNDCQLFINKLNQQTGLSFRLPTEAEWEFAARGGNKNRNSKFSGSNDVEAVAWFWKNSGKKRLNGEWNYSKIRPNNCMPHNVKSKKANELGLYDMSGNLWEWVEDWSGDYTPSAQNNPKGPISGDWRVIRGGGWDSESSDCRVSRRRDYSPEGRSNFLGLRIAL